MDWKAIDKTRVKIETGFINLRLLLLGSDIDSLSILILSLILTPGLSGANISEKYATFKVTFVNKLIADWIQKMPAVTWSTVFCLLACHPIKD